MFRLDKRQNQPHLFSDLDNLPRKQRERLEGSWAGTYRHQVHDRLDERPFSDVYEDVPSRPNYPVRVLLGFENLKAGFGWSDDEAYDHVLFDLQVRYALGLDNLGEADFTLRTVYNFRHRIVQYMQEKGKDPVAEAFAQITDEQIKAFALSTKRLRMDSTQVSSNIRHMSRLQRMVEVLQRLHRVLSSEDRTRYADAFAPYVEETSGKYVHHLRGEDVATHMQQIGEFMQRLLAELVTSYGEQDAYQILQRVFREQFNVADDAIQAKAGQDISPDSLRSPDDPDATFRRKAGQTYEGYVANVTETCDPDNPVQLVTMVQVEPNNTEDAKMLVQALPELKSRTDVEILYTDAAFCSPGADQTLREQQVEQVPTDLRGKDPNPEKLNLADFGIARDAQGKPQQVTCPGGQTVVAQQGRRSDLYLAYFAGSACQACPQRERCPARTRKRDGRRSLRFDRYHLDIAERRRRSAAYWQEGKNLRSAIEATVGAIKRPFPEDQLPVRGQLRMAMLLIGSALMLNVRRIQRYVLSKRATEGSETGQRHRQEAPSTNPVSFWLSLQTWIRSFLGPRRLTWAGFAFGC